MKSAKKHLYRACSYNKARRESLKTDIRDRLRILYNCIIDRVKRDKCYQGRSVEFNQEEFVNFGINREDLRIKINEWEKSNFEFKFSPSVDRIDNSRGYSLDNIQFLSISENTRKRFN